MQTKFYVTMKHDEIVSITNDINDIPFDVGTHIFVTLLDEDLFIVDREAYALINKDTCILYSVDEAEQQPPIQFVAHRFKSVYELIRTYVDDGIYKVKCGALTIPIKTYWGIVQQYSTKRLCFDLPF